MAFTPCTTGTVAVYAQEDGSQRAVRVEAWDDTGAPYIAGPSSLVAAAAQPGFNRLEQASSIIPPPALPPTIVDMPRGRGPREPRGSRERPPDRP